MSAVILMSVCVIVESASAGVLHQQLNKFYRSGRCVSKIALELTEELKTGVPLPRSLQDPAEIAR
jgi:hypothetical protein